MKKELLWNSYGRSINNSFESCKFIEKLNIKKQSIVIQFLNKTLLISSAAKNAETPSSMCSFLICDDCQSSCS